MDFGLLSPEVNSARMYAGPGSRPLLAAAAGWDEIAAQLESAASGYFSEVSGLAGQMWFGPSSMRMAAAATPYTAWLQASAAQAAQTSAQAYAAAAAYEAAFAMTVPPPAIAANRSLLMALIATNFFGQNGAAIAATEAQYMQMWVQDTTAMYTYAADSSTASTLSSYNEPPRTTNEAGQGAQTRALAQTTANTTSAHTQTLAQTTQSPATHQLAMTNAVTQQLSSTTGTVIYGPGSYTTADGGTLTVNTGGSVTVGGSSSITVDSAGIISVGGSSTLTVDVGSTLTVDSGGQVFVTGLSANPSMITIASSTVTVGQSGSIVVYSGGTNIAINGGVVSTTGNFFFIDQPVIIGPATITPVTPITPSASGAVGAAAATTSSPGLAGTAGIQPQLSVDGLLELARTVSAADLADVTVGAG